MKLVENKKGNSNARRIEREKFVCKHVGEIRKLLEVFDTSTHKGNLKVKSFIEKKVRPEIEYNFTTGWWDIFKIIKRTYDSLYIKPIIISEMPLKKLSEYNLGVKEEKIEIEDEYCEIFGCGKKLGLREKLFGKKCINHSKSDFAVVEYR